MKILLISSSFPISQDGSEAAGAFVFDFAQTLAMYAEVHVMTPGHEAMTESFGTVSVHRFFATKLPLSMLSPTDPKDWWNIFSTLRNGRRCLFQLLETSQFDCVLALWVIPSGYWARMAWKRFQVPYYVWALGSDIWAMRRIPGVRNLLRKILIDANYRFADGIGLCRDVEEIAGRHCDFLPSARLLQEPFHLEAGRHENGYRLVFLGRFHSNKGIDLLLESLFLLSKDDKAGIIAVRIAGGGALLPQVQIAVNQLQSAGWNISLEGYKDRQGAIELIEWGDVVLIPSRIESIPVIFSDAMQLGKPVITMPVGDLPDLVKKYDVGLVASEVGSQPFASVLTKANLKLAVSKSCNTKMAAGDFSVANAVQRFLAAADT